MRPSESRLAPVLARAVALAWALGCGTTATPSHYVDGGVPPTISVPPLACATEAGACTCTPIDAGPDATSHLSATVCSSAVAADASCCAGPDYPFIGECVCSVTACRDGGAVVTSCSRPPTTSEEEDCSPSWCSGTSCGGGYCCTSACSAGSCVSSCS